MAIGALEHNGRMGGLIGLHLQRFGGWMMGYALAKRLWGQGLMSEGAEAVLAHAFTDPTVHRVWACVDVEHPASGRVLEKIGMQKEALLRRFSVFPNLSEIPRDVYAYAKIRS